MAWTAPRTWVAAELVTSSQFNAHIRDNALFLKEYAWPVGSIFLSVVSTNPSTLLGLGTWAAFGTGRTLVSLDAAQAEFDVIEETGGIKNHPLTTAEMPAHTHVQDSHGHAITDPGHVHVQRFKQNSVDTGATQNGFCDGSSFDGVATVSATTGVTVNNATPTNQNAGTDAGHNNLQPYITVYMWKRTA